MIRPLTSFSLSLSEVAHLVGAEVDTQNNVQITGVAQRDSEIEPGDLFLAFPGAKVHGANFAEVAKNNGAVAILTDAEGAALATSLPAIVVTDVRVAGAIVVSSLYKDPTRDLHSI